METRIKVKSSSSDEIYNVVFKIENNLISINCNCQAGLVKTLCKHRLNLLAGDISAMAEKSEVMALTDILSKIDKSRISNLYTELDKVQQELKKLTSLKKQLSKGIGLKFSSGF